MVERVIIDGDIIAYRSAAANETRSIRVTHKVTGQVTDHAHRTAFRAHIKGVFEENEFEIEDVQTAQDISFALHGLKLTIERLLEKCGTQNYEIYLSGKTNFRDDLPLPTKYKGQREDSIRPLQLKECRAYLVNKYRAEMVEGREVDDKLAQRAHEGFKAGDVNYIATIDKDAYGVASYLFDWTKMEEPELIMGLGDIYLDDKKVLRGKGRKWYYAQWVKGDVTDCFRPCEISGKKFGDVGCFNLLSDCTTDKECIEAVYKQYLSWYPAPATYTAWDGTEHTKDAISLMDMYAACAHMKRFEDDVFDTRKVLVKMGILNE